MADSATINYGWTKPENGASSDTWGTKLNADLDDIDADLQAVEDKADAAAVFTSSTVSVPGTGVATTLLSTNGGLYRVEFDDGDSHAGKWLVICQQFAANPGVLGTSIGSPSVAFAMSGANLQMTLSGITPGSVNVSVTRIL